MRIWIATVGEPIPSDHEGVRLLRSFQLAQWLSRRGHTVSFITNSVDHYSRRQRVNQTCTVAYGPGLNITILRVCGYKFSISFSRYLSHLSIKRSFLKWVSEGDIAKPDIIIVAYPTIEFLSVLIDYSHGLRIPVVVDCRDAWPDIFKELLPKFLRFLWPLLVWPMDRRIRSRFRDSTAIFSHSAPFLSWAVAKASRSICELDHVLPFTYSQEAGAVPVKTPYIARQKKFRIVLAGTLSRRINLGALFQSLRECPLPDFEFVVAGRGDNADELKRIAVNCGVTANFVGWLSHSELISLFKESDFGLIPYAADDFKLSLPNKFVEYLSVGLPVICLDDTYMASVVREFECGVVLDQSDLASGWSEVRRLALSDQSLLELSSRASMLFASEFDSEIVFSRVEKKLQKVKSEYDKKFNFLF